MSGDLAVVSPVSGGAFVAAIDGVGHGPPAAHAAAVAATALRAGATDDLVALMRSGHAALRGTRGAAITLALVSPTSETITWLGVGNVEGRLLSGNPVVTALRGSLALAPGVAGHELGALRTATLDLAPGDLLILATDGIAAAFADSLDTSGSTQAISDRVMADHRRGDDDALVVTIRYLGELGR